MVETAALGTAMADADGGTVTGGTALADADAGGAAMRDVVAGVAAIGNAVAGGAVNGGAAAGGAAFGDAATGGIVMATGTYSTGCAIGIAGRGPAVQDKPAAKTMKRARMGAERMLPRSLMASRHARAAPALFAT